MTIGAVSTAPVLAPNLLHVIEKRNRQRKRIREVDLMAVGTVATVPVLASNLLYCTW